MKTNLKDINSVTLTEARKQVKDLTDSQLSNLMTKLNKLKGIVSDESDVRYEAMLIEDAEREAKEKFEAETEEPTEE